MAAVLIVVRRLHVPGPQHHWLLGLLPALLIHLQGHDVQLMSFTLTGGKYLSTFT